MYYTYVDMHVHSERERRYSTPNSDGVFFVFKFVLVVSQIRMVFFVSSLCWSSTVRIHITIITCTH